MHTIIQFIITIICHLLFYICGREVNAVSGVCLLAFAFILFYRLAVS